MQRLADAVYLRSVEPTYILKNSVFGGTEKVINTRKYWAGFLLERLYCLRVRTVPKISLGLGLGVVSLGVLAYVCWNPFISRARLAMPIEVEPEPMVEIPQRAIDLVIPKIRAYSLFTSRTPDTLLNLKNTVMTMLKDNKELPKLTAPEEEALVLLAIKEGMTPQKEEIDVLADLEAERSLLWSLANYTRTGSRSLWHRLTGRSLPK